MKKVEFLTLLHNEMIRLGATPDVAEHHTRVINQTFTPEDIARVERITTPEEVTKLAQAIVSIKSKSVEAKKAEDAEEHVDVTEDPDEEIPIDDTFFADDTDEDSDMKVYAGGFPHLPAAVDVDEDTLYEEMIRDDEEDGFITRVSPRGKQKFWIIFACSLPLILVFLLLYFGTFALLFTALASLIVLLIAGLIGTSAIGAAVSFVCIVYGISQLITVASAAPGVYEIGLGITVGGSVMLFGILIYNLAIRVVPKLIRLLGTLFRFCTGKLKVLFQRAKEACYKL
ncbi:MAG: hypothetical protein IIW82_07165 [Clostridia bacterium]|nr:hypothetical protein [Clostridia bacterium]MBQ5887408.1 hypothetical protein [Clostridia bacterium]